MHKTMRHAYPAHTVTRHECPPPALPRPNAQVYILCTECSPLLFTPLQPGTEPPKRLREFLAGGAAPYTWVVAAPPPRPPAAEDGSPEAKRRKGMAAAKVRCCLLVTRIVSGVAGLGGLGGLGGCWVTPAPQRQCTSSDALLANKQH